MSLNKKLFWGGLGWAFGGPIGAIFGYTIASLSDDKKNQWSRRSSSTKPADFIISILVLFAKVMKADGQLLKSELDYVKQFLKQQFGVQQARELMPVLKDILEQEYPLKDVCRQIQRSMDHPSRLQLVHVLFGLSAADGHVHPDEVSIIFTISNYLNVNTNDFESIKAMFIENKESAYKILEISQKSSDSELKKGFRKMANKYHPDKVAHLGPEMQTLAEEKFKAVNDAYQKIKKERGI
ncbi:MAG: DnaJ domain-containing protein [Candidatus Marinimicrobia bacterium]|mgnify:FL=1|jgi:DnaJ like chaperone protein|nr:DnaJ domain-containing protein [Candidatus Neomarinimicrobiota bacterium]